MKHMTPHPSSVAYRKGWEASRRSSTCDMEAAEARYVHRNGSALVDYWLMGWTDAASDYSYGWSMVLATDGCPASTDGEHTLNDIDDPTCADCGTSIRRRRIDELQP